MAEPEAAGERDAIPRRAATVAAGTLASRALGAVRDAVIAASFAVGATDTFFVAFTIPNALRVMLGEGAVANAFIPVFSEYRQKDGWERARSFYAALSGAMIAILIAVSLIGVLAAPQLVTLYAAGFRAEPGKFETTVGLTRLLFPYIFLIGLAALGMGALNTLRRFFVPAFAPSLLNLSMIAAPFLFVPVALALHLPPIAGLAIGALVGGALQVVVQFPALAKLGMLNLPRLDFNDPGVRKALRLMMPLMLGVGVYEINIMLARLFASCLPPGSQSFLYYGQRLVEIPQGMFALAIASATLPTLADLRNRGQHDQAKDTFLHSVRLSLFVAIPSSIALAVLAEPTVTVIFGRGAFGREQVLETARALVWMAVGVWAVASVRNVVQMYYAYNDTRTPVLCSAFNLAVFASCSLALMGPMRHMGIAAATSAAAMAQLFALLVLLRRRIGSYAIRPLLTSALRCATSGCLMGLVVYGLSQLGSWEKGGNHLPNLLVYLGTLSGGVVSYVALARLLRAPELADVFRALRPRSRVAQT